MIDKDWMISTGAPMGPFGILDMVGLRTAAQIERNAYAQTKDESHKEIADKMEQMIQEGHEGSKEGRYLGEYADSTKLESTRQDLLFLNNIIYHFRANASVS